MRTLLVALAICFAASAHAEPELLAPRIERLISEDGAAFSAHIFDARPAPTPRAAVVLLHGGGWVVGDATWVYPRARRFAEAGMLTVAVD